MSSSHHRPSPGRALDLNMHETPSMIKGLTATGNYYRVRFSEQERSFGGLFDCHNGEHLLVTSSEFSWRGLLSVKVQCH